MTRQELRERVARAICVESGFDPDDGNNSARNWQGFARTADAALAALSAAGFVVVERAPVECAEIWLTAALTCEAWAWDADQHEAAAETRDELRAMLAAADAQQKEDNA